MHVATEIVMAAAQRFGLPGETLEPLGGSEGALFRVHCGAQVMAVKLLPVPAEGRTALEERWDFVAYLATNGVRVAQPLPSLSGATIEWLPEGNRWWAAVMLPWLPGEPLAPQLFGQIDSGVLRAWGRTMGQLHALAQHFEGGQHLGHWHDEAQSMVDLCPEPQVQTAWRAQIARLRPLTTSREVYGLLHNDLHSFNIVVHDGQVAALDFDVCGHHWFACDIAIALQSLLWVDPTEARAMRPAWERMWQHFWPGYQEANRLDPSWLQQIGLFLDYRRLLLYSVFQQEWCAGNGWQRAKLAQWRSGIVSGQPVESDPWWIDPV